MYRVMIVDDEPIIRKGLRETIEWDNLGLEVSGEASDGIEALEIIKAHKPHIIITDISMPKMNGIELIREIKKLGLELKIIILSGYSDYTFLKEAIKHGVESYLLKPIDNDELISNLIDCVNNIEKEIIQITRLHQGVELLRSTTLNRLVTNAISISEFEEKASFLNISIEAGKYLCAICIIDSIDGGVFDDDEQLAMVAIHNICNELADRMGITFIDAKGRITFLFFGDGELGNIAEESLNRIKESVLKHLRISMTTNIGTSVKSLGDIWKSYNSAVMLQDRRSDKALAESGELKETGNAMVNHAISYISEHYNEGLTLKQMASIYRVNTSYFGQLFKKETGESYTEYINKCRIQNAKKLLSTPGLKVYEIAEKVGFTDYHYFLKVFKKITGSNPTEMMKS